VSHDPSTKENKTAFILLGYYRADLASSQTAGKMGGNDKILWTARAVFGIDFFFSELLQFKSSRAELL
jgi:hypothetical protein